MPPLQKPPSRGAPQATACASTEKKPRPKYLSRLLLFVLINGLVLNPTLSILNSVVIDHHKLPSVSEIRQAIASNLSDLSPLTLLGNFDDDSLGAMLPALRSFAANPNISPYQAVFFRDNVKFQYPLTSLLPLYLLQHFGVGEDDLSLIFNAACCLALLGILILSIGIALRLIDSRQPNAKCWRTRAIVSITVAAACLLFYPIMHGFFLGQIQTIVTFGFTAAFYCWISGREKTSGAIIGLMALIKPQYALFLLWAAMRKKFGAAASGLAAILAGVLASCFIFGFHNNFDYLNVLHFIGTHGESYATNQSMNGLLNRLLFNGSNLVWNENAFAPFNPTVYAGTILSFLALVSLCLFFPWGPHRKSRAADFACCLLVATMASPVAWEHHYGILVPIFIWLCFAQSASPAPRSGVLLLATAYIFTSNHITLFDSLAPIPILNILQSYLFFGALLVLILLLKSPEVPALAPRPADA